MFSTFPLPRVIKERYYAEHPDGTLMLKADRSLPYSDVAEMLSDLRQMGGKQVSLAVE